MNTKSRLFTAASVVAVASTVSTPVLAEGTLQGTSVQNTVNVTYSVGGVQQTATTGSDSFVVDRKINLTVSELGGSATSVAPNQQDAVTTFVLRNSSNDTLDFLISAANVTNGQAGKFGTDGFDVANVQIYRETGTAGLQTSGPNADILLTDYVDELAPDTNVTLLVVADVPNGQANNTRSAVTLTATAAGGGSTGSKGTALANDSANANVAGTVQNVFADAAANGDAANNGQASDKDDYLVGAASVAAAKTSKILWDPINGSLRPKMIPGAVVEYCIAVTNASNFAPAEGVTLTDYLQGTPPQGTAVNLPVTYLASGVSPPNTTAVADNSGIGVRLNGGLDGNGQCDATGTGAGTFNNGVVTGNLGTIASPGVKTLMFRVYIN